MRKNISTLKLHHNKHTAGSQAATIAPPAEVLLPLTMHSGSPAEPVVAVGDYVRIGQLIAAAGSGMSSPVHATVS
ncbi:MAG: electron transport complex subunit C, partial [Clostridia bacterium]|nr:electron transport complex subunit C [Clostridia bacterium]